MKLWTWIIKKFSKRLRDDGARLLPPIVICSDDRFFRDKMTDWIVQYRHNSFKDNYRRVWPRPSEWHDNMVSHPNVYTELSHDEAAAQLRSSGFAVEFELSKDTQ